MLKSGWEVVFWHVCGVGKMLGEWLIRACSHPWPYNTDTPDAFIIDEGMLHRDVSPSGVSYYGICNKCGSRMDKSATLCDNCSEKPVW